MFCSWNADDSLSSDERRLPVANNSHLKEEKFTHHHKSSKLKTSLIVIEWRGRASFRLSSAGGFTKVQGGKPSLQRMQDFELTYPKSSWHKFQAYLVRLQYEFSREDSGPSPGDVNYKTGKVIKHTSLS